MLVFGHVGITIGAAALVTSLRSGCATHGITKRFLPSSSVLPDNCRKHQTSWFILLGNQMDLRLLALGSLLPDIIDKPVGITFFSSGQVFCHTLLFLAVISIAAFYLWRAHGKTWLAVIASGVLAHLVLDTMWLKPRTLLWPLYGWAFPTGEYADWPQRMLHALPNTPEMLIPELVGLAILVWFAVELVRRRKLAAFIKHGDVQ